MITTKYACHLLILLIFGLVSIGCGNGTGPSSTTTDSHADPTQPSSNDSTGNTSQDNPTSKAPTLTGFSNINKTYGNPSFDLTDPTSDSLGTFSYSSSNVNVATLSGHTVTLHAAGTTTIQATQAASGNFTSGTASAILSVAKATPTMNAISNVTINSDQYAGLCVANDIMYCNSENEYLIHFPNPDASPDPGHYSHQYTTFTSSNSNVIGDGVTNYAGDFYAFNDFNNYFNVTGISMPDPIVTTITITQAESNNYTSASTSFTLTINPTSGGYCLNDGVLVFAFSGSAISGGQCLCSSDFTGSQCEAPAP